MGALHTIKISSEISTNDEEGYPVFIGTGIIDTLPKLHDFSAYSRIGVITDNNVAPLWCNRVLSVLPKESTSIILPAGEEHKTIEFVKTVWAELTQAGFDRRSLILN